MEPKSHWEHIYTAKAPTEVGWYQAHLYTSLKLIARTGVSDTAHIIDIGGGASTLVDDLLNKNFKHVTVLDISTIAIHQARTRLGQRADEVIWLEADITHANLPPLHHDVWHDRATFHFLTSAEDRRSYINAIYQALKPKGHIIVATFALDGPLRCSGLDVVRYSPKSLHDEFGDGFQLIESCSETHLTPSGALQKFIYCYFRKY